MGRYIMRRAAGLVPTTLMLLLLVVILIELIPGDIVDLMLQEKYGAQGGDVRAALEEELGLDRPLPQRYAEYVGGVLFRGDLGDSLWSGSSVRELILGRALVTIEIGIVSLVIGIVAGISVGIVSALRQDSLVDYVLRSIAILLVSIPSFVTATALVVFPAIWWRTGPSLRYVSFTEDPAAHLKIIIFPAMVLAVFLAATLMRIMRTTMLEVLRQDYIRTARAKGMPGYTVVMRHATRNALIPVVTLLGLQVTFLISGSVVTEAVFAIPGIGRLLLDAITSRDYPVVQGVVVVVGIGVMLINLAIDLSYAWIDPRIRYS